MHLSVCPAPVVSPSDSAYTVAAGVPTICAMGVEGSRHHSPEEYASVESLYARAKALAYVVTMV